VPCAGPTANNADVLDIGKLHIGMPAVQAALSGYSDSPMRRVARRWGAPYALAEMILDELIVRKGRLRTRRLNLADDDHPIGGQLAGAIPENFAPAAREFVDAGYDVVDLNFGCPLNKVLGRCRGGYLLSQPQTALEIVDRTVEAVAGRVPVTVKMRRGTDDSPESAERFWEIFEGALARGVSAITVHGRTVKQKYIGPSNRAFLAEVKRRAGARTVLGSGDLFTAHDVLDMMRATGVDGVTVARGAIGNPWIFREAAALLAGEPLPAPPSVAEQRDALDQHHALTLEIYGPDRTNALMRKVGIQYAGRHPRRRAVKEAMIGVATRADWTAVLERWYSHEWDAEPETAAEPDLPDCAESELAVCGEPE